MDRSADWESAASLVFHGKSLICFSLSATSRISRVEESAFRALREKLFAHTSALISAFKAYDKDNTGKSEPRDTQVNSLVGQDFSS